MHYAIGAVTKGADEQIPRQIRGERELFFTLESGDATGNSIGVWQEEEFDVEPCLAPYLQHLRSNRIRTLIRILFFLREEFRGTLVMRFTSRHVPTAEEKIVLSGIADLVALALQLTRLSEESREAAIAREREFAAEQRAGELVKANKVIRKSLAKLAGHSPSEMLLRDALEVTVSTLGASSGSIWLYDRAENVSRLFVCFEDEASDAESSIEYPVSRLTGSPTSHHLEHHLRGEIHVDYEKDFLSHPSLAKLPALPRLYKREADFEPCFRPSFARGFGSRLYFA